MLPFGIPAHEFFLNKNQYTGSIGAFRFRLAPEDEKLRASIWQGSLNYEKSSIISEKLFELSAGGLAEAADWIYDGQQKLVL